MNIEDIQKIIALVRANDIDEVEVELKGVKLRVTGRHKPPTVRYVPMAGAAAAPAAAPALPAPSVETAAALPAPAAPAAKAAPAAPAAPEGCPPGCVEVLSPMLGTFYRAPAPDAEPFTEVGKRVEESTTVCIIEAMKLMNEIKAETKGVVRKILVENGEPVEFNQPLMYVEKA